MKKTFILPHETHLKLFLDECLSDDLVKSIHDFLSPDYQKLEIIHLANYYRRGEGDESWLPKLQKERDWIVVTKDHGRDPKKPKLPDICKQLGITHLIISETIVTNAEIKHSLVTVFPHMTLVSSLPKGTQVRLNLHTLKVSGNKIPILIVEGKRIDLWFSKKEKKTA